MANDPSQYPKQVPCTPDGTPLYTSPPSGGGGGAVTVADGADVTQGATTDTTSANTVIGRLKNLLSRIPAALGANGGFVVEGVAGGVAQPISGTVAVSGSVAVTGTAANTEFAEDAPAADGALGKLILVVRKDTEGTNVSADGDYATLQTDALGRLRVATGAGYSEDAVALDGDRGLFILAMRHDADTTTVSADGDYSAVQVDANGRVKVDNPRPSTGTSTSVANATSNTSLLVANSARRGATVFNDDTAGTGATLKIALGFTASATAFTYACPPQGYYEVPFGFTGAINAIASAATGNARLWEGTP